MTYLDALTEAMTRLGQRDDAIFLGQAVAFPGTAMTQTFAGVPREKLTEVPVFENTQLGLATGLSLAGALPICVFPRINFLLCAMDQLLLHLDALSRYSAYCPKVILRTASPTAVPLDPGERLEHDRRGSLQLYEPDFQRGDNRGCGHRAGGVQRRLHTVRAGAHRNQPERNHRAVPLHRAVKSPSLDF